jgi:hypothetical protein
MNYVNIEKLNEAMAEIGKYVSAVTISTLERAIVEGIQDWYNNQSNALAESDTKSLGIKVMNEYAFDEEPF